MWIFWFYFSTNVMVNYLVKTHNNRIALDLRLQIFRHVDEPFAMGAVVNSNRWHFLHVFHHHLSELGNLGEIVGYIPIALFSTQLITIRLSFIIASEDDSSRRMSTLYRFTDLRFKIQHLNRSKPRYCAVAQKPYEIISTVVDHFITILLWTNKKYTVSPKL